MKKEKINKLKLYLLIPIFNNHFFLEWSNQLKINKQKHNKTKGKVSQTLITNTS